MGDGVERLGANLHAIMEKREPFCFQKEGDLKVEGEQQDHSRKPAASACDLPRNRLGTEVRRRQATTAIGTFQQRPDGAAWQDPGGLAQVDSGACARPASLAAF